MATNMQFAGSASLSITGTTPPTGPTENVAVAVNYSSGNVDADDKLDAAYTVNAGTTATAVDLGKLIALTMLWIQTNNPIVVTVTQDLGAGLVDISMKVESFLMLPATITGLKLANPYATSAKVALVAAGNRAPIGAGAGIF